VPGRARRARDRADPHAPAGGARTPRRRAVTAARRVRRRRMMNSRIARALVLLATAASACGTSASADPAKPRSGKQEVAILAGGCFWGMENVLRDAPGVI